MAKVFAKFDAGRLVLPYGCGRSYGDSCLAVSDHVLVMSGLNRLLAADWNSGLVIAEAGLTLAELIRLALPRGWFLPVVPGTKFVTLGGAVANDVHGKNHHVRGTFGAHVTSLTLYRSDDGESIVTPNTKPEMFAATIGGLGLTGIITTVALQLRRVPSSFIEQRTITFGGLDEFFDLADIYDRNHEYSVAWVDCLASGRSAGRGHYIVGDHASKGGYEIGATGSLEIFCEPPVSLVNSVTLRAFNSIYYRRQLRKHRTRIVGHESFFFPLDGIGRWNRIYGPAGFQQYQCVVPHASGREVLRAIMKEIAKARSGSFLAVLKRCGSVASPGLLSFPLPGVSLALDFPQRALNSSLFERLDALVHDAGGRLYPAKDAHMSGVHFRQAYPDWERVETLRDPRLMSKFWKRVTR